MAITQAKINFIYSQQYRKMNELTNIEVELPRKCLVRLNAVNRRFIKMGYSKLQSLKRDSLPVIENSSVLKRYKTERSSEKQKYVNQFCEFNYDEDHSSHSSLRVKKHIQPLCIYKKPKVRENFLAFRKKLLPKLSDKKLNEQIEASNQFEEKEGNEFESNSIRSSNQSSFSFGENELITFYPNKWMKTKN